MNIIVEKNKSYKDIGCDLIRKIKTNKLPLVCLSGSKSDYILDFNYVVYNKENEIKGKFINLDDAVEYAEFLSYK